MGFSVRLLAASVAALLSSAGTVHARAAVVPAPYRLSVVVDAQRGPQMPSTLRAGRYDIRITAFDAEGLQVARVKGGLLPRQWRPNRPSPRLQYLGGASGTAGGRFAISLRQGTYWFIPPTSSRGHASRIRVVQVTGKAPAQTSPRVSTTLALRPYSHGPLTPLALPRDSWILATNPTRELRSAVLFRLLKPVTDAWLLTGRQYPNQAQRLETLSPGTHLLRHHALEPGSYALMSRSLDGRRVGITRITVA